MADLGGRAPEVTALARRWREALEAWAIPDRILRDAPESPWGFPVGLFRRATSEALSDADPTPSRQRALEALGAAGTVLDVGAGAGAAGLPLAPPATHVTAVDESGDMLDSFQAAAAARPVPYAVVPGRWPDVAGAVGPADVVVCHHVAYNVADLLPFVEALDSHARRRVVVELTASHPQSDLNPLWRELHGIERPDGPTADDAAALLRAMGLPVGVERFKRPSLWSHGERADRVAFARRRLCVGPERDADIERMLPGGERSLVTLWWDRAG